MNALPLVTVPVMMDGQEMIVVKVPSRQCLKDFDV